MIYRFLASCGAFPLGPTFLAWGLNNAAGQSVRAVSGAVIIGLGTCGAFVATWTYLTKDAPDFHRGHYINLGAQAVACVLALIGILYTKWENAKRERGGRNDRVHGLEGTEITRLGYRNPAFRYMS